MSATIGQPAANSGWTTGVMPQAVPTAGGLRATVDVAAEGVLGELDLLEVARVDQQVLGMYMPLVATMMSVLAVRIASSCGCRRARAT